jgi:hypothetical protein
MITIPTVFVLGAGASVTYGFPLGLQLLNEINEKLTNPNHGWWKTIDYLQIPREDVSCFLRELILSGQPSVDAFLEQRSEFLDIGKLVIALAIASHEIENKLTDISIRTFGFYHYLFTKLSSPKESFSENKLSIITFNYDRSIEQFLYLSLKHSWNISDEECRDQLKNIPIIHVHGSLGLLPWQGEKPRPYSIDYSPEDIHYSSEQIIVIPEVKETSEEFTLAYDLLEKAKIIYFLGFGYNRTNLKRLGIDKLPQNMKAGRLGSLDYSPMTGTAKDMGLADQRTVESEWGIKLDNNGYNCLEFLQTYARLM